MGGWVWSDCLSRGRGGGGVIGLNGNATSTSEGSNDLVEYRAFARSGTEKRTKGICEMDRVQLRFGPPVVSIVSIVSIASALGS